MLVSGNEGLIAELVLKVNSKGFDAVAHGIRGRDARQVLEEVGHCALVNWLLEIVVIIRAVALLLWWLVAAVARGRGKALR